MNWDPTSISQEKLHEYRRAAEAAWGDDTRHESYIGHPNPSAGQCYVTSRWLTSKMGGLVGSKDGHYIWVSPDKKYGVDLTGDLHAYPPHHPAVEGMQVDGDDEHWTFEPEHKLWRPGPVMFKRMTHPLFQGTRVKEFKGNPKRLQIFSSRADAALGGNLPSHTADFGWGGDAYPGQEPGVELRMEHDRPDEMGPQHYKWVYANGRLELSPEDDYDQIADFVGVRTTDDHSGPVALGECTVDDGRASFTASSNLGLSRLAQVLQDHCRTTGWAWGGLKSLDGNKLAHSMWMAWSEETGHLFMSPDLYTLTPFPDVRIGKVEIVGLTATVDPEFYKEAAEGLDEWALDHHISLNTLIKTPEDIDGYDTYGPRPDYEQGATNITPPSGTLRCPECGKVLPSFGAYILHRKEEEPRGDELDQEDGHFPEMDQDKVLPPHFHDREPRIFPLAKTANKLDAHTDQLWYSEDHVQLGAYVNGELVGQATINQEDQSIVATAVRNAELVFPRLIQNAQERFDSLDYWGPTRAQEMRLARLNFVETRPSLWKWAKGKEPMDMIKDPIPFIFDVDQDKIIVGQPGQNPHALIVPPKPGKEGEPQPIVQGLYNPGGVITITSQTDYPWTVRHLVDLWYWSYPMMRVTDVEYEDPMGQTQKLTKTASDVGPYVKQLAAMDPAVWKAYQALEDAGGEVFVVGGAVRDALMGIPSNDIDLMVRGLHQDQVDHILSKLPGKMDLTGKSFGVYRYNFKGHEVEVALPRTEKSTGDKRVDFDVNVDHNLSAEDDLLRRDFTINSMAVSLKDGRLVDPFGGANDIKNGVLRTTHPSSFQEDPTRTLRALVMNARYGVQPDERTRSELEANAHRIHNESWDNMNGIIDKLFKAKNPAGALRLAQETGVLPHVFPELSSSWDYDSRNPHHAYPLGTHHMHVLEGVQDATDDPDMRIAAALHDVAKPSTRAMKCNACDHAWKETSDDDFTCPNCGSDDTKGTFHGGYGIGGDHAIHGQAMVENRLMHMKLSKARIKRIGEIVRHHMFPAFSSSKGARKFLNTVGDHADDLLTFRHADMYGKGTNEAQNSKTPVDSMRNLVEQARQAPAPTALSGLAINGKDVLDAGVKPGPQVGEILNSLMEQVIENPELNSREALMGLIRSQVSAPTQPQTF